MMLFFVARFNNVIWLFCFAILGACTQDPCTDLCEKTAEELNQCLQDWPVQWQGIGYSSQTEFSDFCSNLWAVERSTLEPRALDDAYEQCEEARVYFDQNTQTCDQLRALYLLPSSY